MVLLTTTIAAFMSPFDSNIVNLAFPSIGKSINAQLTLLVWILVAYLIVSASFQASLGRLGDIGGRKRIFAIGIILFTFGSFLASLSPDIVVLIASRVIQGVGAASMSGTSAAIVADSFGKDRGRALGINQSATYLGLSLGPIAGGFLVESLGWRSIFYVNIPVGIAALILAIIFLPQDKKREGAAKEFDTIGAFLLTIFLVTLMLALSQNELAMGEILLVLLISCCIFSLAGFIIHESKFARKPIIDLRLFTHNRLFSAGNATAIFNYATFGGTVFVIPLYLELVRGFSPIVSGLILFAMPIVQTVAAPAAGALSDRIGARTLCSAGMFFRSLGLFALAFLNLGSPAYEVWIPLLFIGLGHGMFSPPNTNSVISSVAAGKRGIASGVMGTVRTASNSAGVIIMGALIAASMPIGTFASMSMTGSVIQDVAGSFVSGMHNAFLFAAAFNAIGIFTSLVRGREKMSEARESL